MEYVLEQSWRNVLRAVAQIVDNIRKKHFACLYQFCAAKQVPGIFRYHYSLLV
jgi:hypothetical protein